MDGFDLSQLVVPEGAVGAPLVTSTIEGIIDEDDLRELAAGAEPNDLRPAAGDDPSNLKKLREKHHQVARLIANGLQQSMVSKICGYSEGYLSVLLNNPAMVELIELYRIKAGNAVEVATEKLRGVGLKAMEKLEEKIEADQLNANELIGAAKLGLDRGGLGPQQTVRNVGEQHIIDHAKLAELNRDARQRNSSYIVPVDEVRKALPPPTEATEGGPEGGPL